MLSEKLRDRSPRSGRAATRVTTTGAISGLQKMGAVGAAMSGSTGKSQPPIGGRSAAVTHPFVVGAVVLVASQAFPGEPGQVEAIEMVIGLIITPVSRHSRSPSMGRTPDTAPC